MFVKSPFFFFSHLFFVSFAFGVHNINVIPRLQVYFNNEYSWVRVRRAEVRPISLADDNLHQKPSLQCCRITNVQVTTYLPQWVDDSKFGSKELNRVDKRTNSSSCSKYNNGWSNHSLYLDGWLDWSFESKYLCVYS